MIALLWVLLAYDGAIAQEVARYETAFECEVGRVQWEQQHAMTTECVYAR